MKGTFLIHITLPDYFDQNFYELIPVQRRQLNQLMEQRIVLSYSLDMERKNVWLFVETKNEQTAMDLLSTFSIIKYVKVSIQELAFMQLAPNVLTEPILN